MSGPGGQDYAHEEVRFEDYAHRADGYWLFEPASPRPDTAPVVAFHHGYGAINPMIYGAWIRHLVRQGYIVIYPRYQRNLFWPTSSRFVRNASKGIKKALHRLKTEEGRVYPDESSFFLVGHSYGGTISANMACNYQALGLPQPKGVMLCAPGTGPLKGGLLEDYGNMPASTQLLIVNSINDYVVAEVLGQFIYATATNTPQRNLIRILPDSHGQPALTSAHNECYALDTAFDTGLRNMTARRALGVGRTDMADYYGFWKLLDGMIDYELHGIHQEYAFGDTPEQRYLGTWSDGRPVRELEVWTPDTVQLVVKKEP